MALTEAIVNVIRSNVIKRFIVVSVMGLVFLFSGTKVWGCSFRQELFSLYVVGEIPKLVYKVVICHCFLHK